MNELGGQYELRTRHEAPGHIVTYRTGPLYRMAFCSCGWRGQVSRGNALAQSAKLRGQVGRHVKEANRRAIEEPRTQPTPLKPEQKT